MIGKLILGGAALFLGARYVRNHPEQFDLSQRFGFSPPENASDDATVLLAGEDVLALENMPDVHGQYDAAGLAALTREGHIPDEVGLVEEERV